MAQSSTKTRNSDLSTQDLSDQIATLREDLGNLTEIISGLGKAKSAEVSDKAKDQLEALRQEVNSGAHALKDQASRAQSQATEMVQNQPGTAIGIAAGLGFLVGFLSGRK